MAGILYSYFKEGFMNKKILAIAVVLLAITAGVVFAQSSLTAGTYWCGNNEMTLSSGQVTLKVGGSVAARGNYSISNGFLTVTYTDAYGNLSYLEGLSATYKINSSTSFSRTDIGEKWFKR
jgi:hypothetical protein